MEGYEKIADLGQGAYGKVCLVQKNNEKFALKTV